MQLCIRLLHIEISLKELILADLKLKLIDAALHAQNLLLKSGLLGLQVSDLLLQAGSLGLLVGIVTLNLLFNAVKLVGEGFASVVLLHGEDAFEGFLLAAKDLHLLLVGAELRLKPADVLIKVIQFTLEVSGVIKTTLGLLTVHTAGTGAQGKLGKLGGGGIAHGINSSQRFPCKGAYLRVSEGEGVTF